MPASDVRLRVFLVEDSPVIRENLVANELDPDNIPLVIQYNKRDLPNAASLDQLNRALNARGVPFVEASAKSGKCAGDLLFGR